MADIRTNEILDNSDEMSLETPYNSDTEINYDWYDNQDINWLEDYYIQENEHVEGYKNYNVIQK